MIIHNVMEDLVYTEVNKLFDEAEEKKEKLAYMQLYAMQS